jgi:hypothetical protein
MTIIKNHFEVFLVTSKKQENRIIESKVGLYSIKANSHIIVSCGQDSVSAVAPRDAVYFILILQSCDARAGLFAIGGLKHLSRTGFKNFKKIYLLYLHCPTHFTKVILAKTL